MRRLVESVVRYLLRWTTRATPFGRFAGVAPVSFGTHAAVRWGADHHEVVRPDGEFLAESIARAERDPVVLGSVAVMTNPLGFRRGGMWVLPCARADDDRRWDVEIRLSGPVRAAIQAATSPARFADLAAQIAGPALGGGEAAERLLAELVKERVLLSAVRPAMTVTDPSAHLAQHHPVPDPGSLVAFDLRMDSVSVTLPPAVLREASNAASTLVALAPRFPCWDGYHDAFIERWGPGAAVPVRQVLAVLGYPAGYRGSARRTPAG